MPASTECPNIITFKIKSTLLQHGNIITHLILYFHDYKHQIQVGSPPVVLPYSFNLYMLRV